MGNCFSDPSSKKDSKKAGHVLGSAPSQPAQAAVVSGHPPAQPTPLESTTRPGQMLGDGFEDSNRTKDPREMARLAAEERIKAVSLFLRLVFRNGSLNVLSNCVELEARREQQQCQSWSTIGKAGRGTT